MKRKFVKKAVNVVVGCGVYLIVDGTVKTVTRDPFAGICKKLAIGAASLAIEGMLYEKLKHWTDLKVDEVMDEIKERLRDEETETSTL